VIWRCWQDRTPYDEARYEAALRKTNSPLVKRLDQVEVGVRNAELVGNGGCFGVLVGLDGCCWASRSQERERQGANANSIGLSIRGAGSRFPPCETARRRREGLRARRSLGDSQGGPMLGAQQRGARREHPSGGTLEGAGSVPPPGADVARLAAEPGVEAWIAACRSGQWRVLQGLKVSGA
jgi:hypothetical protein